MIVPVVFVFLFLTLGQSNARRSVEGNSCKTSDGTTGVCKSVIKCKSIYDESVAGKTPNMVCGYEGANAIVCCPPEGNQRVTTTTTQRSRITRDRLGIDDGRGEIARAKCKYYSQSAYDRKYTFFGDLINISRCSLNSKKLLIGGTKAEPMEFPHMVAIGVDKPEGGYHWFCGGSLISENYVLTAAHCVYSDSRKASWARVGDLNLMDSVRDGATPSTLRIVDHIRHPGYKPPQLYNDIALFRLEKHVTFNSWIRPACLHTAPTTGTTKAMATGWGLLDWTDEEGSPNLMKVTLPLIDSPTCRETWVKGGKDDRIPREIDGVSMICAGKLGKDTCQGDSGGPLAIYSKPEYECMYDVVGVTSFGKNCGSNFPGVYIRVFNYISWIESIVWPRG